MDSLKNTEGELKKLNKPNYMWVTFADGEAVNAMQDMSEQGVTEYGDKFRINFEFSPESKKI